MRGAILLVPEETVFSELRRFGCTTSVGIRAVLLHGGPDDGCLQYGYGRVGAWLAVQKMLSAIGVCDAALPFLVRWEDAWDRRCYRFAFQSDDDATILPLWSLGAIPVSYGAEYEGALDNFNICFPARCATDGTATRTASVRRRLLTWGID